jgi:hypothetical protein
MLLELVKNLLHLERGRQRLDQHRSADCTAWYANMRLGEDKDIVPEASLEVMLEGNSVRR